MAVKVRLPITIFTGEEAEALASLFFSRHEIAVLKLIIANREKKSTKQIARDTKISPITARNALDDLEEKGIITSEPSGKSILWFRNT